MKVEARHTKRELENAIKVIKKECKAHELCDSCPFSMGTAGCIFNETMPAEMDINEIRLVDMEDER